MPSEKPKKFKKQGNNKPAAQSMNFGYGLSPYFKSEEIA